MALAGGRLTTLDRRIIALAIPALGSLIVEPLYTITDTAIVGHLGRAPLGGLALATTVLNLIGWTAAFLEMATTSQVAFRRGRGDAAGADTAATAAYLTAGALGVVVALIVAFAGPPIAQLLGGSGAIQHNATTYLHISAVGMPFLLLTFAGTGHLQGHEDTKTPLRIVLLANLVNVILEVVLVYGADTGVAGSAWGTVVAQLVAAGCFLVAGRRRMPTAPHRPHPAEVFTLLRDGFALVVRTVALGSALVLATAVAAQIGSATLAGHQIALQMWLLLALTLDALAVPAQVYVGGALGRVDIDEAVRIGSRCLRLGLVVSVAVGLATMALSPALPFIFTGDAAVRHEATRALIICGALQPFAALAFVYDGLLLGAGDYATLRRAMLLALLAFAPLAIATLADHALGIVGIWLALTCWLAARTVLLGRQWSSRRWARAATQAATGERPR
jgi:putative MATE family efflux protein